MARKAGLQAFTVQEATNYEAFTSWNYEELDMSAAATSTYILSSDPAKKVVLYLSPAASDALDATDTLTLTINGETDTHKKIVIDPGDLPFTLNGLSITALIVTPGGATAGEELACLSFH